MKGTVSEYVTAIGWMLEKEGWEVTSKANHRMLEEGNITLEAFQAAAKVIAQEILKR